MQAGMPDRNSARAIGWDILGGLAHPVSLVSMWGPLFLSINLNWLIVWTNGSGQEGSAASQLKQVLADPWAFALADYLIQSYTLVLAVVLFVAAFAAGLRTRHNQVGWGGIQGDGHALLLISAVVGSGVILLYSLTNGVFGSPTVVALYLPTTTPFWGNTRFAPWQSPISIGRVVLLGLGLGLSVWQRRRR